MRARFRLALQRCDDDGVRGGQASLHDVGTEWGLFATGGKGAASKKSPAQIACICDRLGREPDSLLHASRTAAKVDNAAVQDGYQLYHHVFFFTSSGDWSVVQQGMNAQTATARRYHWLSECVTSFVEEPHAAVCCDLRIEGVGPKTLRALALASELIYGYGVPFPVDRTTYDQTIDILRRAVDRARIDRSERVRALKRLARFQ